MFPELGKGSERKGKEPTRREDARVRRPVRNQIQMVMQDLEATLPEEHQARAIWDFLERLNLAAFYGSIQAVEGGPGRPASDPQVLLALWVYATVEGVGSALSSRPPTAPSGSLVPGDVLIAEDLTGHGHIARSIGDESPDGSGQQESERPGSASGYRCGEGAAGDSPG